jgi:glycosyltransferase involved in cell wall biosynthesis
MPNVVLEAMASALPVIVTDVEGCREILADSAAGIVVPPGDAEAFSRHTLWLLSSPEEYLRAAHAARERAEQFSMGNMVAQMEELYDEVS